PTRTNITMGTIIEPKPDVYSCTSLLHWMSAMKPVYETERCSNRPWRLPLIVLTFIVLLICGLPAVARLRHAFAGQDATAPVTAPVEVATDPAATSARAPVVGRNRAALIDDSDPGAVGLPKWEYKPAPVNARV